MNEAPLVINADDAGFDAEVDACILAGARSGIVHSASVNVLGPTAGAFVAAARETGMGLGLHLNLTEGHPLGRAPSLTAPDGAFWRPKRLLWDLASQGRLDPDDLRREALAQFEALLALGVEPDHLDSHNHVHVYPAVLDALLEVMGDRRLHVRIPTEPECPPEICPPMPEPKLPDEEMRARIAAAGGFTLPRFIGFAYSQAAGEDSVAHLERPHPGGTEWMVHPGRRSGTAFTESEARDCEADTLRRAELLERLESWGYRPCRFGDLG